ncbi:hypothetical protein ACT3UQ_18890 [Glutamicibacter sp. AOP12-B1-11]|uniref:hypothetical protein n=1 Tax=Micrococcaceae TaxID=1268 RepID=UPI0015E3DC53|nr:MULTISPECIES: hypothetical protein [unclassified Arthrobacter]
MSNDGIIEDQSEPIEGEELKEQYVARRGPIHHPSVEELEKDANDDRFDAG